jgi:hypothetical protein
MAAMISLPSCIVCIVGMRGRVFAVVFRYGVASMISSRAGGGGGEQAHVAEDGGRRRKRRRRRMMMMMAGWGAGREARKERAATICMIALPWG